MKTYRVIHFIANVIAFGLLGGSLVYFLLSYGELPERIGVHFSAVNGELDVISDKIYGFYPFVMGFGLMLIFSLLTLVVRKVKKLGLKVSEKGDMLFRCAAALLLDLMKLTWSMFFSYWTYCIVQQTSMGDGTLLDAFRVFFVILLLAVPVLVLEIHSRHGIAPRAEKPRETLAKPRKFTIQHIITNIISFGALGVMLVWFLLSYAELPERIGVHFAGDGSFDVIADRIYGAYPFVMGFGLMLIFSLLTLAANKVKRIGMNVDDMGELKARMIIIETLDVFKLVWSMFFSIWAYSVIHQTDIPTTSVSIILTVFLAAFPLTAVMLVITAKKHRIKENKENESDDNTTGD